MRTLLTTLLIVSGTLLHAQKMSYTDFQKEANINKRLLPKYGKVQKSDDELASDQAFIEKSIAEHKSVEKASKIMVRKGYQSLRSSDPKEAMFNFNQAFLLDSNNADIYWGYGQLYHYFDQFALADQYYKEGLGLNPKSTMLLNGLGENCIDLYKVDGDNQNLELGIKHLQSSFMIDPSKTETSRLLTEAYLEFQNCEKAKKYYQVYLATEKDSSKVDLMERMEKKL